MLRIEKNKKQKAQSFFAGVWHSLSLPASGASSSMTCSPDQCFVGGAHTADTSSFSMPQNIFTDSSPSENEEHETSLVNLLPADLYAAMKEAAKKGFLYSFLSGLTEEFVTERLVARHYTPQQIHWANQAIRALTFIALGASFGKTVMTPIANFVLTTKYVGLNEKQANYLTTASMLAMDVLINPAELAVKAVGFSASMAASLSGGQLAKFFYRNSSKLVQNSLFAMKEFAVSQEKIPESRHLPPKPFKI